MHIYITMRDKVRCNTQYFIASSVSFEYAQAATRYSLDHTETPESKIMKNVS